ncbi:MAG: hypothetical protein ACR2QQ_05490 [Gammaproteobacteria bacterium]
MKIVVVAVISMIVGVVGTYMSLGEPEAIFVDGQISGDSSAGISTSPTDRRVGSLLPIESVVSRRAELYSVAARADEDNLTSLLDEAISVRDPQLRKDFLIALSLRIAELSPDQLDRLPWASFSPLQAAELGAVLLEELGVNGENIDRVVAALPQLDPRRFRVEALVRWAGTEPDEALESALSIDDWQLRSDAVERIAAAWADADLIGAIAEAERLGDDRTGRAFQTGLIRRMSEIDPATMVSYVNRLSLNNSRWTSVVVDQLRLMEPLEALGWAEKLEGRVGTSARRAALESWGQQDPLAAFAYAESMPLGEEQQQLLHTVATAFGRQDPEAAIAWAESLSQTPEDLLASVVAGIAEVDLDRAFDLAFSENEIAPVGTFRFSRGRYSMLNAVVRNAMAAPDREMSEIIDRVLSLSNDNERNNVMRQLTDRWIRSDAEQAFDWITTEGNLPEEYYREVISSISREDPVFAARYVDTVPVRMRAVWIASVAQNYARLDPLASLNWLEQYRDEPIYPAGVASIVHRAVEYDPNLAAELLSTINDGGRNAQEAADTVARSWVMRDRSASRLWLQGLSAGPVRDAALRGYIREGYRDAVPEAPLLSLFSSEEAKQRAVSGVLYQIGSNDPEQARRLANQHISLPDIRRQFEEWLDRREEEEFTVYRGGVIVYN